MGPTFFKRFLFFKLSKAISLQDLLDRFSRFFHQMTDICMNVVNLGQIFRFLKGRCHGNQFWAKLAK